MPTEKLRILATGRGTGKGKLYCHFVVSIEALFIFTLTACGLKLIKIRYIPLDLNGDEMEKDLNGETPCGVTLCEYIYIYE